MHGRVSSRHGGGSEPIRAASIGRQRLLSSPSRGASTAGVGAASAGGTVDGWALRIDAALSGLEHSHRESIRRVHSTLSSAEQRAVLSPQRSDRAPPAPWAERDPEHKLGNAGEPWLTAAIPVDIP